MDGGILLPSPFKDMLPEPIDYGTPNRIVQLGLLAPFSHCQTRAYWNSRLSTKKYIFPYPKPSAAKPPHPRNIRLPRLPIMHHKTHREIKNIPPLQRMPLACQRIDRQRPPIRHKPGETLRARIRKQRPARLPAGRNRARTVHPVRNLAADRAFPHAPPGIDHRGPVRHPQRLRHPQPKIGMPGRPDAQIPFPRPQLLANAEQIGLCQPKGLSWQAA